MRRETQLRNFAPIVLSATIAISVVAISVTYFPLQTNVGSGTSGTASTLNVWAGLHSPARIQVRYYYYGGSGPLEMNFSKMLRIIGWPPYTNGSYTSFDGSSNFTITPNLSTIPMGGPNQINEGTSVVYQILAKVGSSGTYEVNLGGVLLPRGIGCESDLTLQSGNGMPYYQTTSPCSVVSLKSNGSSQYPPGYVFVEILGTTNSSS